MKASYSLYQKTDFLLTVDCALLWMLCCEHIIVIGFATSEWIYSWLNTAVSVQAEGAGAVRTIDACNTSLPWASALIRQTECSACYLHYLPVHRALLFLSVALYQQCCILDVRFFWRYSVLFGWTRLTNQIRWTMSRISWIMLSVKPLFL